MSTTPVIPAGVRASDAEREHTVRRLQAALAEGRLELGETDERVTAAYASRHREELTPLVADLPGSGPPGRPVPIGPHQDAPAWASIWESLVWRAHLLVQGPQAVRPTAAQCRNAVALAAAGVLLFLLCAVLGALVVGA